MSEKMVCIRTFANRPMAEFVRTTLEADWIPSIVSGNFLGYDLIFGTGGVKLLVRDEDVARAEESLANLEKCEIENNWEQADQTEPEIAVSEEMESVGQRRSGFRRFCVFVAGFSVLGSLLHFVFACLEILRDFATSLLNPF